MMSSLHHIWKNRRLSVTTKTRIYQTLVQSVLLYAAETWTLLSVDARALEAFHMKCQRQLLRIKWHQFVRSDAIAVTTGLLSISKSISCRCNTLFRHVARLQDDVPAHKALNCQVNLSLGRPSSDTIISKYFDHAHVLCLLNA